MKTIEMEMASPDRRHECEEEKPRGFLSEENHGLCQTADAAIFMAQIYSFLHGKINYV